jgi:hypothetical protein
LRGAALGDLLGLARQNRAQNGRRLTRHPLSPARASAA